MATFTGAHTLFETVSTQGDSTAYQGGVSLEAAEYWSKMSMEYSGSGYPEAALRARQNAVNVYRLLHEAQHNIYEGRLARELLELSKDMECNGRIEEALEAVRNRGCYISS
ncbi:hypothetical protein B0J17DRAFT_633360 [Rhizoctonia solani]|nr:hypothetical protein B0J17DRAFT_633360 [Rhizoctonia solani]